MGTHECAYDFCTFLYLCRARLEDKKLCEKGIIRSKGISIFMTLTLKKCFFILHFNGLGEKKKIRVQRFFCFVFVFRIFKTLLPDGNDGILTITWKALITDSFIHFLSFYCTILFILVTSRTQDLC